VVRDLSCIPKSELHLHLRGAMPLKVFLDLIRRHPTERVISSASEAHRHLFHRYANIDNFCAIRSPTSEDVRALFRYQTFEQFLATWTFTGYFVRDKDDFRRLVQGVVHSLREQAVVYAEITVSIIEYLQMGIALVDIADCLTEGCQVPGIRVQWIVDLVRDTGPEKAHCLLRDIIALRCPVIIGITLGGSEHLFPPAAFRDVYADARDRGLCLTVHAGEALGPASIWDAIRLLGVQRVGHGVRAVEDPVLVAYLAEHEIPLEVCLTSNIRTGIYPSYDAHPVLALLNAGVPITINSDDPAFFDTQLTQELTILSNLGLDETRVRRIIENGFRYAFLPPGQIQAYLDSVDRTWNRPCIDGGLQ